MEGPTIIQVKFGPMRYIVLAILFIILIIVAVFIYRIYFLFDNDKVRKYAEKLASTTADPNLTYKLLIENIERLKKSETMICSVKLMAEYNHTDKEQELVNVAWAQCFANGWLATVPGSLTIPT